jgi:hypothetical protein
MAKEKQTTADFDLGFSPEEFEKITPDQGIGRRQIKFGDYTFEISAVDIQTSKGKTPHNMLKVTARVVAAAEAENKAEIGSEITSFYAGSPQSPEFMKKRLKALCVATGVTPKNGGLKGSQFIGKRFDASIVWELSKGDKLDDFGRPKMYVNDRLKGERKVGEDRPAGLNPAAESAKAQQHMERGASLDFDVSGGDRPAWELDQSDAAGSSNDAADAASGFVDESEVDAIGMAYRAVYKLGGDQAEQAKETLISAGIDPDGPVELDMIEDPAIRQAYEAKFAPKPSKPGLPPLINGKGRAGTRAPVTR